jgi:hypothetical protein
VSDGQRLRAELGQRTFDPGGVHCPSNVTNGWRKGVAHREHLMQKLGPHSLSGLTKLAIREGLTSAEE